MGKHDCEKKDLFDSIERRLNDLKEDNKILKEKVEKLEKNEIDQDNQIQNLKDELKKMSGRIKIFEDIRAGIVNAMFKDMFKIFLSIWAVWAIIYAYFKTLR